LRLRNGTFEPACKRAGVEFTNGKRPGVRMRKETKEALQGLVSSIVMMTLFFVAFLYSKQISYYFTFFSIGVFVLMVVWSVLYFLAPALRRVRRGPRK
jgi:hypothetical protein